jgi:hypothetical protein
MMLENRWLVSAELWEVTKSFGFFRASVAVFLILIATACTGNETDIGEADHIQILDEIPEYIREVENLTIFPGDSEPTHTIELIPEQVFGEDNESNLFWIYKAVEDDNDRLIIWGLDSNRGSGVYVYNADGSFRKQLGRQGRGPGEYGSILGLYAKAGKIFISDFTSLRLNEYSANDYTIERSIKFEQWNIFDGLSFKRMVIPRNDGNYLLAFSDETLKLGQLELIFKVMDSEGDSVSVQPVVTPSGFAIDTGSNSQTFRPSSLPLDFMGSTVTDLSNEDVFYVASTNEFLVKKYDANGVYQSAFYYPVEGPPFDLEEYLKEKAFTPNARRIRGALDEMNEELPKAFPIINQVIADDENRIWVSIPAGAERESIEWWVLRESGELVAKLFLPRIQRIYDIKNGYLYARKDNGKRFGYLYSGDGSDEADAEYVVKYKIEFREAE